MFSAIQGTGHLVGARQFFVRLAGCSIVDCEIRSVCDEVRALTDQHASSFEPSRIVEMALQASDKHDGWLHITGGEPCDQPDELEELLRLASEAGLRTHVQSSGTRYVPGRWDWITISPKVGLRPVQDFGQECVVIYDGQSEAELRELRERTRFWDYYLCPLWRDGEMVNPQKAAALVHKLEGWRLTCQMHKWFGIL